jgi:hypothetical protein
VAVSEREPLLPMGVILVALLGFLLSIAVGTAAPDAARLASWAAVAAVAVPAGGALLARGRGWIHRWRVGAVAIVIVVGAILRFRGITFGLPYVPHPDEPAIVNVAQRMLVTGDLDPHRFIYPSLYLYLQALAYALHLVWGFAQGSYREVADLPPTTDLITTAPGIYLWGRALTALLGTGTIPLVYGIGRRLYGPRVGLVAATLLAFSPAMIDDAHLITVDVPAAFFTSLAFFWIVALHQAPVAPDGRGPWWPMIRAGIGVGLAASTKYNAALIVAPLVIVPLLRRAAPPWRVWSVGASAAAVTCLLATPFAIPELPTFLDDTAGVLTHYRFQGHPGFEGASNWRYYAGYLWQTAGPTFPVALGGLLLMAYRARRADLLALPFPLLYFAALADLKVNFTRNLMPLYPFLALLGAVGLLAATDALAAYARRVVDRARAGEAPGAGRRSGPTLVALAALPILLCWPTAVAGRLDNLRATPDSRVAAQRWMGANLSRGTYWLVDLAPQQWRRDGNACSTAPSDCGPAPRRPFAWYPAHGFSHLLLVRHPPDDPALAPDEAAWYREALAHFAVVREFPGPAGPGLILLDTGLRDPPMQQPAGAVFGTGREEIALRGYSLGRAASAPALIPPDIAASPAVRPGESLRLALHWRPSDAPREDYRVFVHLRNTAGETVAQHDARPQQDTYATDRWRAGTSILDTAQLALPPDLPPGRYTIVVGLYPAAGARLPVRGAPAGAPLPRDELPLASIEVMR